MLDNITVDERGQVIALEDAGDNSYLGGVYQYDPSTGGLTRIAENDPARFAVGGSLFITQDEEASGVIPAPFLGAGKYLINVQAHKASSDPELVEGGQLLVLDLTALDACPTTFAFDFSGTQCEDCFRDVLRGGQINAGPDVGPTDHPSLVFTGSTGSGGDTWLTVYDATPSTPAPGPMFGAETLCADVLFTRFSRAGRSASRQSAA